MAAHPRLLAALLYGAPRRGTGVAGRTIGGRMFLPLAALPMLLGVAMCLLLQLVDPYDLRPWGMAPKFADANYPALQTTYLMVARTNEPHDLILFGGSTMMAPPPALLRKVFDAKTAVNLAYNIPSPEDTRVVLLRMLDTPGLKRLIVGVDHTQMGNSGVPAMTGDIAMTTFRAHWFDMPDFNLRTIQASAKRAAGGTFDLPNWRVEPSTYFDAPRLTTQPDLLATLDDAVTRPAKDMFTPPALPDCGSYRFINRVLIPVGRAAAQKGVQVDMLFPPLPFVALWGWQKKPVMMSAWTPGSDYLQLIRFHQCIVRVVAEEKLGAVRIHAVDTDAGLTGDPTNYRDTVHLTAPAAYERMFRDIRDGKYVLTPEGLDAYAKTIDAGIRAAGKRRYLPGQPTP